MEMHSAALPMVPGSEDLIRFPDQDCWYLTGDRQRAARFRGAVLQLKAGLVAASGGGLISSTRREYSDGTVIEVRKAGNIFQLFVHCPLFASTSGRDDVIPFVEPGPGQFFYLPECVGRFDFTSYVNAIPKKKFAATMGVGRSVVFLKPSKRGLPAPGVVAAVGLTRDYRVAVMPGDALDTATASASALEFPATMLPSIGAWSVSCMFRLDAPVQYDYTFSQLDVLNAVRPRVLFSGNGTDWRFDCPGSVSPLVGYMRPSLFSSGYVDMTYPWPPYNNDFSKTIRFYGYKEIVPSSDCWTAPLLESAFSDNSPYWDNVSRGDGTTHPYPLPHGVMIGINFMGMMLYDGNRLLAGKVVDFENEWNLSPIISNKLDIGSMYFVCLTHDESSISTLYINKIGTNDVVVYRKNQSTGKFPLTDEGGASLSVFSGGASFHSGDVGESDPSKWYGSYRFSASMDLALPRFFHRALRREEVNLLLLEAFQGVFVADDHEAAALVGRGLQPLMV